MSQPLFSTPANIKDFEKSSSLTSKWDKTLEGFFNEAIKNIKDQGISENEISIFDPRSPPSGQKSVVNVTWGGFPNVLLARYDKENALHMADQLLQRQVYLGQTRILSSINYRPQDEYLEWVVKRDESTGKIKEIIFTCEGPEYWTAISEDKQLLLNLYRNYACPEVELNDLFFTEDVFIKNNGNYELIHNKNDYNLYNKWNLSNAIHLIQPNNTLFAEIVLASEGSILRKKNNNIISNTNELICCSGYGVPNRNSDPTIGSRINSAVRNGNWISLQDPVGIYINDIDTSSFQKPDGSPIADFKDKYWKVIRGSQDNSMILRAHIKVPEGEMFEGSQLLLGDLLVNGETLRYGGQVADAITVGLYAVVIAGGPHATVLPCTSKCCIHPQFPNTQFIQDINNSCPSEGDIFMFVADDTLKKEITDKIIANKVTRNLLFA